MPEWPTKPCGLPLGSHKMSPKALRSVCGLELRGRRKGKQATCGLPSSSVSLLGRSSVGALTPSCSLLWPPPGSHCRGPSHLSPIRGAGAQTLLGSPRCTRGSSAGGTSGHHFRPWEHSGRARVLWWKAGRVARTQAEPGRSGVHIMALLQSPASHFGGP